MAGDRRFGTYWLLFGYTLALHVLDEAGHNFLSVYNPNAAAIRKAVPWLRIPIFTFEQWAGFLLTVLVIWLGMAPFAARGMPWTKRLAVPVAVLAGIGNGLAHILSSIYLKRMMPGVYSAPLILFSGIALLRAAIKKEDAMSNVAGAG